MPATLSALPMFNPAGPARRSLPLPYLGAALALHILILSLPLRTPQWPELGDARHSPLHIRLRSSHPAEPPATLPATPAPPQLPPRQASAAPTPASTPAAALQAPPAAPASGSALADSARQQIHLDSRAHSAYLQTQRHGYQESESSETLSALGRALQKSGATRPVEKRLANGILQITNPDGSTYCIQPTSDLRQRDTPVALLAVPSNCP